MTVKSDGIHLLFIMPLLVFLCFFSGVVDSHI